MFSSCATLDIPTATFSVTSSVPCTCGVMVHFHADVGELELRAHQGTDAADPSRDTRVEAARGVRDPLADFEGHFLSIGGAHLRRLQNARGGIAGDGLQQSAGQRHREVVQAHVADLGGRDITAGAGRGARRRNRGARSRRARSRSACSRRARARRGGCRRARKNGIARRELQWATLVRSRPSRLQPAPWRASWCGPSWPASP